MADHSQIQQSPESPVKALIFFTTIKKYCMTTRTKPMHSVNCVTCPFCNSCSVKLSVDPSLRSLYCPLVRVMHSHPFFPVVPGSEEQPPFQSTHHILVNQHDPRHRLN